MKLTDLNLDCLEANLEYLDFGDLLNVALSNKRLNRAAGLVFIQKYQQKKVFIEVTRISQRRLFKIHEDFIEVNNLKTCLQLLRCFGRFISTICYSATKYDEYILRYINEYCSESLSTLELYGIPKKHLNMFTKPLIKVEQLLLSSCYFDVGNNWLKILFPKMKRIKINFQGIGFRSSENAYFAHHFPHLEHFEIFISKIEDDPSEGVENFKTMFRLNPQLKTFHSFVRYPRQIFNANFFQNVLEHLQNLETLYIRGNGYFFEDFNGDIMHFKNVRHFCFNLDLYVVPPRFSIPFSFGKLESFYGGIRQNPYFNDLIRKYPMIKKLTLIGYYPPQDITELEESLPSLTEIDFLSGCIPVNLAHNIIKETKSVKLFTFAIPANKSDDSIENLPPLLGDAWVSKKEVSASFDFNSLDRKVITVNRRV